MTALATNLLGRYACGVALIENPDHNWADAIEQGGEYKIERWIWVRRVGRVAAVDSKKGRLRLYVAVEGAGSFLVITHSIEIVPEEVVPAAGSMPGSPYR